jgi:hypothetical protein
MMAAAKRGSRFDFDAHPTAAPAPAVVTAVHQEPARLNRL